MSDRNATPNRGGAPVPPERWRPDEPDPQRPDGPVGPGEDPDTRVGMIGNARVELRGGAIYEFQSARRLITASQVCAIVSFFIGGVFLSAAALVCAAMALGKLNLIASAMDSNPDAQRALRRLGYLAIGLSVVALVINIVALIVLYPMVMEAMQSGSFGSLFGGGSTGGASGGSTGNTTWG